MCITHRARARWSTTICASSIRSIVFAYHINDHTGTPVALVDDDGNLIERYTWSPTGDLVELYRTAGAQFESSDVGLHGLLGLRLDQASTAPTFAVEQRSLLHARNRV